MCLQNCKDLNNYVEFYNYYLKIWCYFNFYKNRQAGNQKLLTLGKEQSIPLKICTLENENKTTKSEKETKYFVILVVYCSLLHRLMFLISSSFLVSHWFLNFMVLHLWFALISCILQFILNVSQVSFWKFLK